MREHAKKSENGSRTIDNTANTFRQASANEILQAYKDRFSGNQLIQRESIEEEDILQGKFDVAQREELEEDELLQGKFESAPQTEQAPIQREEKINNTGLPDNLKAGIENLSGYSMNDVKVHYNSDKPAQLNALAYAQGTDIHVASGQEKYLPHEAWHVVQQKQGRVQPTMQLKGLNINDKGELEQEADVMGNKSNGLLTEIYNKNLLNNTLQKNIIQKTPRIRIGIVGENNNLNTISDEQLIDDVFIWILTNKVVKTSEFFPPDGKLGTKLSSGAFQKPMDDIISLNIKRLSGLKPIRYKNDSKHIFVSNTFWVPRGEKSEGQFTHDGVDYSFLRYAALKMYQETHGNIGFPPLQSGIPVETIDSDFGGITGENIGGLDNYDCDSLAYAGVYSWNWEEVKDNPRIQEIIPIPADRYEALQIFSEKYLYEEVMARTQAASSHILNIYFPEPATRLTSNAVFLLENSNFGKSANYLNQPLGHARESIKLIAALAFLDSKMYYQKKQPKKGEISKRAKQNNVLNRIFHFEPKFVVKTNLGSRKEKYISLFIEWYNSLETEIISEDTEGVQNARKVFDKEVVNVPGAMTFDQSYLKRGIEIGIKKDHEKTIDEFVKKDNSLKAGDPFF